jgi:hypothetical protein
MPILPVLAEHDGRPFAVSYLVGRGHSARAPGVEDALGRGTSACGTAGEALSESGAVRVRLPAGTTRLMGPPGPTPELRHDRMGGLGGGGGRRRCGSTDLREEQGLSRVPAGTWYPPRAGMSSDRDETHAWDEPRQCRPVTGTALLPRRNAEVSALTRALSPARADAAARFTVVSPTRMGRGALGICRVVSRPVEIASRRVCHGRGRALHRMGRARHGA